MVLALLRWINFEVNISSHRVDCLVQSITPKLLFMQKLLNLPGSSVWPFL